MKKHHIPLFAAITLGFACFTLGFFLGRNPASGTITVSLPPSMQTAPTQAAATEVSAETMIQAETQEAVFPININTASPEMLQALPGIGEVLSQRIVAYRQTHGPFQAVEELMNVEGIGEKRMAQVLELITIGG